MRYALYFTTPQDHALTREAASWLGRDAFSDTVFSAPDHPLLPAEAQRQLTSDPRRYGFHATIKAPFDLAATVTEADLLAVLEDFAAHNAPVTIPRLILSRLGRFFALVPADIYPPLQDLAARVVRSFEPFRAPLSQEDIARRKPERLTESQRQHLMRWGYPYVMNDFAFHMTLSNQVPEERLAVMHDILTERFAAFIGQPLAVDALALFKEPSRGAPFIVEKFLPLTGSAS